VCLLEHRRLGLNTRAWLVTEAVTGEPLQATHIDAAPTLPEALQALVGLLAAAGITHGDMKASNFLTDGHHLWLIDLDAMCWRRCARTARAGLRRDIARFLRNWKHRPDLLHGFGRQLESWT